MLALISTALMGRLVIAQPGKVIWLGTEGLYLRIYKFLRLKS